MNVYGERSLLFYFSSWIFKLLTLVLCFVAYFSPEAKWTDLINMTESFTADWVKQLVMRNHKSWIHPCSLPCFAFWLFCRKKNAESEMLAMYNHRMWCKDQHCCIKLFMLLAKIICWCLRQILHHSIKSKCYFCSDWIQWTLFNPPPHTITQ